MYKEFYIGTKESQESHSLDVSAFTSLEQLAKTLADTFAFADTKCAFLLSCQAFPRHSLCILG